MPIQNIKKSLLFKLFLLVCFGIFFYFLLQLFITYIKYNAYTNITPEHSLFVYHKEVETFAQGSWVSDGKRGAHPTNTSQILCNYNWKICIESTAQLTDDGWLQLDNAEYEITKWVDNEEVIAEGSRVIRNQPFGHVKLIINIPSKGVSLIYSDPETDPLNTHPTIYRLTNGS